MVSQFYPPIVGGQEQHVRNLARALVARGHEVTVATTHLAGQTCRADDEGVDVHRVRTSVQRVDQLFTSGRRFAPPFPDPEAAIALRRLVRKHRPQVIHAHDWLGRSLLPGLVREPLPVTVTLHDYSLACAQKRFIHQGSPCLGPGFRKCLACSADHYGSVKGPVTGVGNLLAGRWEQATVRMYLPVSQSVADLNQLARRRLPFRVVPNFLPDAAAATSETNGATPRGLPVGDFLLFVGDVTHDKGAAVLLEAYRRLENPPPLVLIGRQYLPAQALPAGAVALGVIPPAEVAAAWRRSIVGLVPSIVPDSCPTVVLEAMAAGRPVIGARSGGIPDLVDDGRTGILVPPADPTALAAALRKLIASPELRQTMGDSAQRRFSEFSATRVVPRIEQVYAEILDDARVAGSR